MASITVGALSGYTQRRLLTLGLAVSLTIAVTGGTALFLLGWPLVVLVAGLVLSVWLVTCPRQGFYALLAVITFIDGTTSLPHANAAIIYRGIDDLVGIGLLPLSPLDMGIGLLVLGTVLQTARDGSLRLGGLFWPLLLLTGAILIGYWQGITTGGNPTVAFHEVRALLYLLPVYFLTANLVREPGHIRQLSITFAIAVSVMAFATLWEHFTVIRPGRLTTVLDLSFAHENGLFTGLMVILAGGMMVWGRQLAPRVILGLLALLALAALLVMQRRLAVLALDVGLLVLAVAMLRWNWRLFILILPVALVGGMLYLSTYWNSTGSLGQGARVVRSAIGDEAYDEDRSSDDYRQREEFNVWANIRWNPVRGLGFGHVYAFPASLPDLTAWWPLQQYIPHNTILWLWMKGGILAFVLVATAFGYAMTRGMMLVRVQSTPLLQAWSAGAAAMVPMMFLFAWYDLGLVVVRATIIFAICLGIISAIESMQSLYDRKSDNKVYSTNRTSILEYGG